MNLLPFRKRKVGLSLIKTLLEREESGLQDDDTTNSNMKILKLKGIKGEGLL